MTLARGVGGRPHLPSTTEALVKPGWEASGPARQKPSAGQVGRESPGLGHGRRPGCRGARGIGRDFGVSESLHQSFGNQAPTKVQCAECHWLGLSSELIGRLADDTLCCPICATPFARYPQKVEHLWSDPY